MEKLANTLENKAKFFSQYWGQLILMQKDGLGVKKCIQAYWEKTLFSRYIELTPLSQITDEDAIEVAKIEGYYIDPIARGKSLINYLYLSNGSVSSCSMVIEINDYLRSKRYALPWMGLSVDDLISYGWVKLKED